MRIAYLVPEFPGQTHIFFWREMHALRAMGVEPELISTQRPVKNLVSHRWSCEAISQTRYLWPMGLGDWARALLELLRAGPTGWWRCLRAAASSRETPWWNRLSMLSMVLPGALLGNLAKARGCSHLHAHSCANSALLALFANRLTGLTYSITLHGPLRDYGLHQRAKWRHALFGVVITNKLLAEVKACLGTSLPPDLLVAPMGVDTVRFRRAMPYAAWDGRQPARIFSCGRLNFCKGHEDLIRAVGILRAGGLDCHLHIAGEDENGGTGHHRALDRLVEELSLSASVRLLGAISEDRVQAELESAHVFSLASLEEPLGVAIMEAMAMEVPVVVTDAGGVRELVRENTDGLFVPPRSPQRLAEAIAQVLRDTEKARRMGASGLQRIRNCFGSDISARVLAERLLRAPEPGI